jgi:hypothetical protein
MSLVAFYCKYLLTKQVTEKEMSRGHVVHIDEEANGYGFWLKSRLEDIGLNVRIIFKWILSRATGECGMF